MGDAWRRGGAMTRRLLAVLLVALATASACDDRGPGTILVTVEAPDALGAVALEVVGAGVRGFEGVGTTQAYGGVVSARQGRHRVVLVDPVGGTLRVGIRVDEIRAEWPTVRAVSAAGSDDVERSTSDLQISVARQ
ncbi:MAG: hypothetical protein WD101_03015 [Gemmatimonadota bacterium]